MTETTGKQGLPTQRQPGTPQPDKVQHPLARGEDVTRRLRDYFTFGASQPKLEIDLEKLRAPSVDLWATSPERDWYISRRPQLVKFLLPAAALAAIAFFLAQPDMRTPTSQWWAAGLGSCAMAIALWCTVPYWAARRAFLERRAKVAAYRADAALHQLGPAVGRPNSNGRSGNAAPSDIPLATLFQLNRRQLDAYQELTRRQQRNSFRLAQAATVVGMAVLITGIVLTFQNDPSTNDYVVGGLTGLGALLSAFLGHTFYRAHREANEQLNWYYTEPYAMGRLLVAERIAQVLCSEPTQQAKLAEAMVTALLSWELPHPGAGAGEGTAPAETVLAEPAQQ